MDLKKILDAAKIPTLGLLCVLVVGVLLELAALFFMPSVLGIISSFVVPVLAIFFVVYAGYLAAKKFSLGRLEAALAAVIASTIYGILKALVRLAFVSLGVGALPASTAAMDQGTMIALLVVGLGIGVIINAVLACVFGIIGYYAAKKGL